ncbi:MAG TPA: hypothetical protein VG674_04460 [Amycolatopsis sp.]|nr:hypothetical protein [Amycolatopsis sp.]
MDETEAGTGGRWVSVRLQRRHVHVDDPGCADPGRTMSYDGIVIGNYDRGELVSERWIPLGADPSEEDDEVLIEQLRAALLWQAHCRPQDS